MKKPILNRYELTEDNKAIIDVSIHSIQQLYHDFDKRAPYHRKELDQEFVDYLTECVREIGKNDFIIRLSLDTMPDESLVERIKKSIHGYYVYLKEIENNSIKRVFRRSGILFCVGIVLMFLAILANRRLTGDESVVVQVFAEGLTIASWVSLWEAMVNIFLEWHPHNENIRLYNRVIDSQLAFRPLNHKQP